MSPFNPFARRAALWVGGVILLLIFVVILLRGGTREEGHEAVLASSFPLTDRKAADLEEPVHRTDVPDSSLSASTTSSSKTSPLPDDVEGQRLDASMPLLSADLIRIFDQILGHDPAHPGQLLAGRVPAESLAEAQRLLAQYIRYRESLSGLQPADYGSQPSQKLEGILNARRKLQLQYFSQEEGNGLFGDDNRYDAFSVERLRITERDELNTVQKAALIAQQSARLLSPAQQEARQTALLPALIQEQNRQMAQENRTPEERLVTRTAQFGTAAAERMAQVDREEAAWQQRIARLAQADEAMQKRMRETEFSPTERLRLDAALSLYRARQQRESGSAPGSGPSFSP